MLLRQLPVSVHDNPELLDEDRLSHAQRRIIRDAHGEIRVYDVGWRKNWAQVFGSNRRWGWVYRLLCGGRG